MRILWPFNKRLVQEPCFPVGQYRIDARIDGFRGLTPLSIDELAQLNRRVMFVGEQIWHAPDAQFMNMQWDTVLGTVENCIYKISAQWTGPRHEEGKAYREIAVYCTKNYGRRKSGELALWDASDGNIVLDSRNIGSDAILNLFLTSRKIRQFRRV